MWITRAGYLLHRNLEEFYERLQPFAGLFMAGGDNPDSQHVRHCHQDRNSDGQRHLQEHSNQYPGYDPLLTDLRCATVDRL
jgi:hypothetical protein